MSYLVTVTYLDDSTEVVTREEADVLREAGELKTPEPDGLALTTEDVYGSTYRDDLGL